jgi:hypothetical protein
MDSFLNLLKEYPCHAFIFELFNGEKVQGKLVSLRLNSRQLEPIAIRIEMFETSNTLHLGFDNFGFATGQILFIKHIKAVALLNTQPLKFILIHENK